MNVSVHDRFWRHVSPEPNTGCWLWTGLLNRKGYGVLGQARDGKNEAAHRVSHRLFVGPTPPGLFVCHRCDVRHCVNPAHLFLGSHKDNMRDMVEKGRVFRGPWRSGGAHWRAHLSDADVMEIRVAFAANESTQAGLARRFGVSASTVRTALIGLTYTGAGGPVLVDWKRKPRQNVRGIVGGVEMSLDEAAAAAGISREVVRDRVRRGASLEAAVSKPARDPHARRAFNCPRGHEYTPTNARLDKHGYRVCRICSAARDKLRRRRQ